MNKKKLTVSLFILFLLLIWLNTNALAEMRGYWMFEEDSGSTAYDSSGFGNDGFLCDDMDTTTCWVNGKRGGALKFDGIDDYVDCGDSSCLTITDALTIEMWLKFDTLTINENVLSNELYRIYHRGEWAGDRIYFLYRIAENMKPGQSEWSNWAGVRTAIELQQDRWYYLVAVMSGDTMRIYVNGEKQGENTCLSGFTKDTTDVPNLYFGIEKFEYEYYFKGTLDEVIIRNRALGDDEVFQRATCGWWKFDEGSGSVAGDSSIFHNDGTLRNMDTTTCWVDGKVGKALKFDGRNDYVDCGNAGSSVVSSNRLTLEAWIKPENANGDIMGFSSSINSHCGYSFRLDSQKLQLTFQDNGGTWHTATSTYTVSLNQWSKVAVTYNAPAGTLMFYKNGEPEIIEESSTCDNTATQLKIGWNNSNYFKGSIDEPIAYDISLSNAEMELHYEPSDCGAELNPTGNPIGGGYGYTDIIMPSQADTVVATKQELLNVLENAEAGDTIFVIDTVEIDLSGEKKDTIPGGVTLASGRGRILSDSSVSEGALLYTTEHDVTIRPLFEAGGDSVRFTGLRLKGPDTEIGNHDTMGNYKFSFGIQSKYNPFEVDNCEILGWTQGVIVKVGCTNAYIHHNYIHHNRRNGIGYGVCLPYTQGNGDSAAALIEANLFDFCRHHIASFGWADSLRGSSYEARYNIVLEHGLAHSFDRHGTKEDSSWVGGEGGYWTLIHHNTFRITDQRAAKIRGRPHNGVRIHHNWFYQPGRVDEVWLYTKDSVSVYNNIYSLSKPQGIESKLPIAKASIEPSFGKSPLTVSFDGSKSTDPDGSIISYQWDFGDGNTKSGDTVSYTYNDVGKYNVVLTVTDNGGILARDMLPVTVFPATGNHILSFWVIDCYRDTLLSGYYLKQAYVVVASDTDMVWEDDISGDEGWQHITVNVDSLTVGKDTVTVIFKVYCAKDAGSADVAEIMVWWDDIYLFGGSVCNWDFEKDYGGWQYKRENLNWILTYTSADIRSGNASYVILRPSKVSCDSGSYAQISQEVFIDTIPPTVGITKPEGGEKWEIGGLHRIEWSASDNVGLLYQKISLFTGDSTISVDSLGSELSEYDWDIPDLTSDSCRIEILVGDSSLNEKADTSNYFEIGPLFSDTSCATALNNQRKLIVRSNGNPTFLYQSSTRILYDYSSNGGSSFVQSSIGDGEYPALASYTDTASNEILGVVWINNEVLYFSRYDSCWSEACSLITNLIVGVNVHYSPPALAIDNSGVGQLAWELYTEPTNYPGYITYKLHYSTFNAGLDTPSIIEDDTLDIASEYVSEWTQGLELRCASIALYNDTMSVITWSRPIGAGKDTIYYKEKGVSGWPTDPETVSVSANTSKHPFCDVANGNIHIVWEEDNKVKYRKKSGVNWTSIEVVSNTSLVSRSPQMLDGDICIFTEVPLFPPGNYSHIVYRKKSAFGWGASVVIDSTNSLSEYPQSYIETTPFGRNLHTVWTEGNNSPYEVMYKKVNQP